MNIKWLGHATFLIASDKGIRIINDPYEPNERLTYGEIKESADIVTVSHGHGDHNNVATVGGNPSIVKETGEIKGIMFKAIPSFHDNAGGGQRGDNTIFCFEVDSIKLCHLGDLGHPLSNEQAAKIGEVDVLMIPVGGNFTIDAAVASQVCEKLTPRLIIPMHFRNERCPDFPVAGVDDFINGKSNVTSLEVSEMELTTGVLPAVAQIVVMKPAL
ncbi:MBL fold metallo-hydrolase [Chloroflexota bacterium]